MLDKHPYICDKRVKSLRMKWLYERSWWRHKTIVCFNWSGSSFECRPTILRLQGGWYSKLQIYNGQLFNISGSSLNQSPWNVILRDSFFRILVKCPLRICQTCFICENEVIVIEMMVTVWIQSKSNVCFNRSGSSFKFRPPIPSLHGGWDSKF